MEQSYQSEFGRRLEIFEKSREMDIYRTLQSMQASYQVFEGNFAELVKLLEPLEDPKESLFKYAPPDKSEDLDNLMAEAKRLLHNFLASAKSLVDHTRTVVKRLYPDDHRFRGEYQKKLNQDLANNPLQKFVQNLRNYTQHYTLPILALQITFLGESNKLNSTLRIDVELLKQWDNWGSSRAYLESLKDGVPIIAIASGYYILIQDFYIWLSERQAEIHQADFDNLERMQQELTP